jgi:citrate synthase
LGHPVDTVSDPRNKAITKVSLQPSAEQNKMTGYDHAERPESFMWQFKRMFLNPDGCSAVSYNGWACPLPCSRRCS